MKDTLHNQSHQESSVHAESLYASLLPAEKDRIERFLSAWLTRLDMRADMKFNAQYHVNSSGEDKEPITVQQFSYFNTINQQTIWLLLALDSQQRLLGIRQTYVRERATSPIAEAAGDIEVLVRKRGVASALEAVNFTLMQEFLTQHDNLLEMTYHIDDGNSRRLAEVKRKLEYTKDNQEREELQAAVADSEAQRISWEKLYGEGGKMGFEKKDGLLVRTLTKDTPFSSEAVTLNENSTPINATEIFQKAIDQLSQTTS